MHTRVVIDHLLVKYNSYDKNRIEAGVIQTNISNYYSIVLAVEIDIKLLHNNIVYKIINYIKLNNILIKKTWTHIYVMNVITVSLIQLLGLK